MLKEINLQLFAEPDETGVEEIEEIETEAEAIEEPKEPEIDKDKYIPKDVALQWKRENKEIKRQIRQLQGEKQTTETKSKIEKIKNLAIERGLSDDVAEIFTEISGELFKSIPAEDLETQEILEDFNDYAEETPEIKEFKKDILEKVKKYRKADPDFSVEDAFRLIKPRKSIREMELEAEQRAAIARKAGEKEPPVGGATTVKEQYPLSAEEKKALKGLQEAHPDRGWNAKKYYELMKKE